MFHNNPLLSQPAHQPNILLKWSHHLIITTLYETSPHRTIAKLLSISSNNRNFNHPLNVQSSTNFCAVTSIKHFQVTSIKLNRITFWTRERNENSNNNNNNNNHWSLALHTYTSIYNISICNYTLLCLDSAKRVA